MDERERKVKEIVSKIIKVPISAIGRSDDLVDKHAMDSLARVEIVTELEKAFDITIDESLIVRLRTIDQFLELISEQMPKR